ncbi:MAG: FMN-binding negative transcriptional regulator [Pseudomonadota bacterium]
MYEVKHFVEDRLDVQHDLIEAHPLGLLVCNDGAGRLFANSIPFTIRRDLGKLGTLRAHLARANPQWSELKKGMECLTVFQGEEAYVSPNWYPSKQKHGKVVPTWNYITVQVWAEPVVIEDPEWLRAQIDEITNRHESSQPKPWEVDDAPAEFTSSMIRGIVGVELEIREIKGKWKVSQNRPQEDIQGVFSGLSNAGKAAIADHVAEHLGGDG